MPGTLQGLVHIAIVNCKNKNLQIKQNRKVKQECQNAENLAAAIQASCSLRKWVMCSPACTWNVMDLLLLQERALHRGVDVICATPGRLNDHFERGNFVRCILILRNYTTPCHILSQQDFFP